MAEYRLHCFAQSGNAYKVALALELAGADWEPVWVDFFKGAHRSPEFVALNAMAEVPVLEHRGTTLSQSGIILDYLTDTLGRYRRADEREAWRWILWDNHKLTANLATWRFLANFLPEEKRNADVIAFLKGRAVAALKVLDRHLEGRELDRRRRILDGGSLLRGLHVLHRALRFRLGHGAERRRLARPDRRAAALEAPARPDAGPPDGGCMSDTTLNDATGGCQCGAVRYRVTEPLGSAGICHCRMCQRAAGNVFAPLVTARGRRVAGHALDLGELGHRRARVLRALRHAAVLPRLRRPEDEIELMIGTLDDPASRRPTTITASRAGSPG